MGLRETKFQENGESYIIWSYMFLIFCLMYLGVLVRKPEGKRPLRRPRRRWEDNIKMDLRKVSLMLETG